MLLPTAIFVLILQFQQSNYCAGRCFLIWSGGSFTTATARWLLFYSRSLADTEKKYAITNHQSLYFQQRILMNYHFEYNIPSKNDEIQLFHFTCISKIRTFTLRTHFFVLQFLLQKVQMTIFRKKLILMSAQLSTAYQLQTLY